jgi:tetratricopeptide (TPR) repeat protein
MAAGTILGKSRRFTEAFAYFEKALEIDRGFLPAYYAKSWFQQINGDYHGSIETFKNILLFDESPENRVMFEIMTAQAEARIGNREPALAKLGRLAKNPVFRKNAADFSVEIAQVYNLLNEREKVFEWLDKAPPQAAFTPETLNDPRLDNLREDSRFIKLAKKNKPNS